MTSVVDPARARARFTREARCKAGFAFVEGYPITVTGTRCTALFM